MLNGSGAASSGSANAKAIAQYIAQHTAKGGNAGSSPMISTTAPTVNSIIPDPVVYGEESAQALQAYQQALSAIAGRRAGTLQNYGMTAQVDANGNLKNYGIDPNNQYGLIQQLLGGEGSQLTADQHAAVARGLGGLGLGRQAESQDRFTGGQAQLNLGRQFVGEIGQEASDQYGATNAYNAANLQAQRDAIASAIQNGYFTPAPQSAGTTPPPMGSQSKTNTVKAPGKKPAVQPTTNLYRNMGGGL